MIVSVLERFSSSLVVLWKRGGGVSMVMFFKCVPTLCQGCAEGALLEDRVAVVTCVVQFVFLKICFYLLCIITLIIKMTIYVFYSILHSTPTLPHLFNSTPDLIVDPRYTLLNYSCNFVTCIYSHPPQFICS